MFKGVDPIYIVTKYIKLVKLLGHIVGFFIVCFYVDLN